MNAAPCADTVPPLIALDASVILTSARGERQVSVLMLFDGPYKTRTTPEEVLTSIRFQALPETARSAFLKLGRRNALSIARLSVAAVLRYADDGTIAGARIVPGAAFPVWQRVPEAECLLIGNVPSAGLFAEAGNAVSAALIRAIGRRWSTEYKEPVIAVLVRRVLELCRKRGDAE
jgi:CO/xanthine dehydrogenase FAD-binding subunit